MTKCGCSCASHAAKETKDTKCCAKGKMPAECTPQQIKECHGKEQGKS